MIRFRLFPGTTVLATTLLSVACGAPPTATGQPADIETQALAEQLQARNHAVLRESLCPAPDGNTPFPPAYSAVDDPRIAPAQVFDNLYFFGTRVDSTWALSTPEGIILFDAMFPYEIEETVIEAMPQFGLDPADIRYVVVSHGHADHFGGATILQQRYGTQVVMSNTEWHYLQDTQAEGNTPLPERDITVLDGDTLVLGDTTVRFITTPGHTPGTISSILPVQDGGKEHLAALWGGTAMNFISAEDVEVYQRSLEKFRTVDAGIAVVLSNHAYADGTELKTAALAERGPDQPHPFVVGHDGFQAWLDVIGDCSEAWLEQKRSE